MLSIIISSYQENNYRNFESSLSQTIGVPYELVKIENSGKMSIAKAYNKGAQMAKFPFLCFLHEDVLFEKKDWGIRILNALKNPETGVVGVAGGILKSKKISGWSQSLKGLNRMDFKQKLNSGEIIHQYYNPQNEMMSEAVCLDGVLLATQKDIWEKHPFDENTIRGFHGYDIDFTWEVSKSYKNFVLYDLGLCHLSQGNFTKDWYFTAVKIHHKHSKNEKNTKFLSSKELYSLHQNLAIDYTIMGLSEMIKKRDFSIFIYTFLNNYIYFFNPRFYYKLYSRLKTLF